LNRSQIYEWAMIFSAVIAFILSVEYSYATFKYWGTNRAVLYVLDMASWFLPSIFLAVEGYKRIKFSRTE
jgi:hypothetical protein